MFKFIFLNLKRGAKKIIDNPQLIYTIFVAVFITGSFLFISDKFTNIANDAQERLINVRIGSLQDAFVSFAGDKINDPEYLNNKIESIIDTNETITNFKVLIKNSNIDSTTNASTVSYNIIASSNKDEIGTNDDIDSFLFTLASSDPSHSITIELNENNERVFRTARAITDNFGNQVGDVISTQTLSQADIAIEQSITKGRYVLIFIIILIMFLLFRYSRIIDYMDLYKKLKEVDQLKDDFVSMASHELRTPLSVIRGYAEFINDAPELSKETKDYVSKIDISAKDLDSLVSDILDVSRIEQGRIEFKLEKISPITTIEQVVSSLEIPAKDKGLSISFDKKEIEGTELVNVDINRLKQILVNIIGNAVKYTNKGEVVVRLYKENSRLYIRVSDTGIGMTEEERVKLFQKFYRIRNKETENIRGTGLGLWITAQMIKQMGGNLSVESIKGVGSHFVVSFLLAN